MPAKSHPQASQNPGKKLRKPRLGAHVPTSGGMAKRSIEYAETIKAEAIQVFTSNPRLWDATPALQSTVSDHQVSLLAIGLGQQ